MGMAYSPKCSICGEVAIALEKRGNDIRWLCHRCNEQIERKLAEKAVLKIVELRASSIHEELLSFSVAYRSGYEGLDEMCPYETRGVESALWLLGSLVALRGAL